MERRDGYYVRYYRLPSGTLGKRGPSNGGGVLLGELDSPFPSMLIATMKYFWGLSARCGPEQPVTAPVVAAIGGRIDDDVRRGGIEGAPGAVHELGIGQGTPALEFQSAELEGLALLTLLCSSHKAARHGQTSYGLLRLGTYAS